MKRRMPQLQKKSLLPVYLVVGIVLLAVGFMVFRGIRKETGNPIVLSASDVPRITAADAIAAVNENKAILVDTRSADQYAASHAFGSISLPFGEIETWLGTQDKDTWYINYCT